MTKICVFSDSHGYADNMLSAIAWEQPDLVIHLGDGEADLDLIRRGYPTLPIENVRGNCDRYSSVPEVLRLTVGGRRIFAAHGHTYGVKGDPTYTRLLFAAMEDEADIVLFGHTHMACQDEVNGMTIMNPGSCGDTYRPSYGMIMIEDGKTESKICSFS